MTTATLPALDLDSEYAISPQQIARFQKDGYIKLKEVLSAEVLEHYGKEITRMVLLLNKEEKPIEQRTTYGKAFLQVSNIWQPERAGEANSFSGGAWRASPPRIDAGARRADLSRSGTLQGGRRRLHAVACRPILLACLTTEKTVTAWIPLHAVPLEHGPLMLFRLAATGSRSGATWRSATKARSRSTQQSQAHQSAGRRDAL